MSSEYTIVVVRYMFICIDGGRQAGVVWACRHKLDAQRFPEEPEAEAWYVGKELEILCFALRKHKSTTLPTVLYEMPDTVPALADAFLKHYLQIGRPISATSQTTEQILKGYYPLNDKVVTCKLQPEGEPIKMDFSYAESVEILDPLSIDTTIVLENGGRKMVYNTLMEDFEAQGIDSPDASPAQTPPVKKSRRTAASPSDAESSASAGPRAVRKADNSTLSCALRKRLMAKVGEGAK